MTGTTYPADAGPDLYLLTVLGMPTTGSGAASRDLHNATAGDPGGVAAAKAFGDLSHNVYLPADEGDERLLLIDTWNSPQGLGTFFADEQVQKGAGVLWADREAVLWMPAPGFGSYRLPVPSGRSIASIGIMRGPIVSTKAAAAAFHTDSTAKINAGRQAGLVAHELWVPAPTPGAEPALEVFGVDYWLDLDQMNEWYATAEYAALGPAFTGAPVTSSWTSAGGDWVEW